MNDLTDPDLPKPAKPKTSKVVAEDGHVYSKSSSANATVAPTSGITQGAAEQVAAKAGKLSEEELDFVTLVDMYWGTQGELMSPAVGVEKGIPEADYYRLIGQQAVIEALTERGVSFNAINEELPEWRRGTLTPIQLIVANVMLDLTDTRNDRKKLQDLNIHGHTWNAWLRQPEFRNYLQARAESLFNASHHEAYLSLVDKVRSGDINAIKLYWEFTGKFTSKADGGAGLTADSARQLIQSIIEIIIEEVDDPEVGAKIAERLKGLMVARQTADSLISAPTVTQVTQPEVMPDREITPEIEAMMYTGVGRE